MVPKVKDKVKEVVMMSKVGHEWKEERTISHKQMAVMILEKESSKREYRGFLLESKVSF